MAAHMLRSFCYQTFVAQNRDFFPLIKASNMVALCKENHARYLQQQKGPESEQPDKENFARTNEQIQAAWGKAAKVNQRARPMPLTLKDTPMWAYHAQTIAKVKQQVLL